MGIVSSIINFAYQIIKCLQIKQDLKRKNRNLHASKNNGFNEQRPVYSHYIGIDQDDAEE